jgi:periplasmic divalent cation tolerance protein
MEHLLVYMTAPEEETARRIAGIVVRERLAAGANILGGVFSIYWWQGKVEETGEAICLLQTTSRLFAALETRIRDLHPYETPCIVAVPAPYGSAPYLRWLEEETIHIPPARIAGKE